MAHRAKINQKAAADKEDNLWSLPLWVLCDGQDADKTFMLGCNMKRYQEDKRLVITAVTSDGMVDVFNKAIFELKKLC